MSAAVTIDDWLQASVEALREVATTALGLEGLEVRDVREAMPRDVGGAFIPLSGDKDSAQVGLAGGPDERKLVSGALMQMPPEEAAELSNSDVADAMGEIVNIAAGGIKQQGSSANRSHLAASARSHAKSVWGEAVSQVSLKLVCR